MKYVWISKSAKYNPKENKNNPWTVDYLNEYLYSGTKYFKTLEDALLWITTAEIEDVTF
jgi:hypothetical protein